MQLQFKFKVSLDKSNPEEPLLKVDPVAFELSQMNFFKDNEEQPMESMMIVSMVNMQLDQLIRHINKQEFPLKSTQNNELLSCFGFNLSDIDVNFYNKFFTIDSAFFNVDPHEDCDQFEADFKKGFYEQLGNIEGGINKKNFK